MLSSCRGYGVRIMSGRLSVVRDWSRILSGVLLLMSGGWLLSWLLFGVSVGCQLVGVLLSSRCRFLVLMLSGCCSCSPIGCRCLSHLVGVSVASDGVRCCPHIGSRAGCSCPPIGCASCRGCRLLLLSRCREGVAVILSGSVAVALRCQLVGGVGVLMLSDWLPLLFVVSWSGCQVGGAYIDTAGIGPRVPQVGWRRRTLSYNSARLLSQNWER